MKRIVDFTVNFIGISVMALAMLTWTASLGVAAEQGHAEHGHVEYGHAAGVGSVHFAPHEAPVHAGTVVRAEEHAVHEADHAVHAADHAVAHVEAEVAHAVYRNPYRDDYFRRFPPGYRPFVFNGAQYYGYYGLPAGCGQTVLNGVTYFLCGGVYFRPYMYGGQTIYLVVPAPV